MICFEDGRTTKTELFCCHNPHFTREMNTINKILSPLDLPQVSKRSKPKLKLIESFWKGKLKRKIL